MSDRIVITGVGWVTPLGHEVENVWARLLAGDSGIAPIEHFDATTFPTGFAGEVRNYDFRPFVRNPDLHEHARLNTTFVLGAAAQAWKMAGLDATGTADPERTGAYLGSGEGSLDFDNYVAANLEAWDSEKGGIDAPTWAEAARRRFGLWREIEQEPNMPLTHLAMELDLRGPAFNSLTACAASTQATGEAAQILRRGDADVMVAGGAHSMIHPLGVTGFNRLTALSTRNDCYTTASRPFNRTRDGFVLGEGAGVVVLETLEHARARGAPILAELLGYGSSADAFRITDLHPEGYGPAVAMRDALDDAQVSTDAIDYSSTSMVLTGSRPNS